MSGKDSVYSDLAERFLADFPERREGMRTVGRELEAPIVSADGRAADVRRLWELLLGYGDYKAKADTGNAALLVEAVGGDASYTIEVGVGTMEINTRPCQTLFEIQGIVEQAMSRLVRVAAAYGWLVLGYGIQPLDSPSLGIMTPKQRYQSLYRAMGAEWLWYTVTAADQCHVAIERSEVIPLLNFGNLMAPVLVALCANSPVFGGTLSPFCSAREGHHLLINAREHRHGMPARPYRDAQEFVERISQSTQLIRRTDNVVIPNARPFSEHLAEHGADYAAFLFHEHYVWNSARVRATYGTLELRPACQQPWREHMAATALGVGLVHAHGVIQAYVEDALGEAYWDIMRGWHVQVVRQGLEASQPAPGFLEQIAKLAADGLNSRGYGEEVLMQPIFDRLERRENPAQRVRTVFRQDGLQGLLAYSAIRPSMVPR